MNKDKKATIFWKFTKKTTEILAKKPTVVEARNWEIIARKSDLEKYVQSQTYNLNWNTPLPFELSKIVT